MYCSPFLLLLLISRLNRIEGAPLLTLLLLFFIIVFHYKLRVITLYCYSFFFNKLYSIIICFIDPRRFVLRFWQLIKYFFSIEKVHATSAFDQTRTLSTDEEKSKNFTKLFAIILVFLVRYSY